ncbi:hypothetical protein HOLleu_45279 [Holothuria leucospilota]|uniref:Uncharacterized protein n=1 Tax=Holothuria leucospilota TaxID=206669 RepID=A0A9Q0YBQ8_HOLLE|nr:hypothetical protein HOLleu_45279 [Holothuria leucospilota]
MADLAAHLGELRGPPVEKRCCKLQEESPVVEWNPVHIGESVEQPDPEWTVVNTGSKQAACSQTGTVLLN